MDIFDYADELEYGELHFKIEPDLDLHAVVAIHSLKRGPAIGGCRFIEYDSTDDAVRDAMRLARGMTYKAALGQLPHGGAKSVLMKPAGEDLDAEQREAMFRAFGRFIDDLDGQYVTAEDSGTSVEDMNVVHEETKHVLGCGTEQGGSGDPSPYTAIGVRRGIEAAAKYVYDRDRLGGLTVALQGVGHVGYHLAHELHERDVELIVSDVDDEAVQRCVDEFGAEAVEPEAIFDVECDIFSPCALGAVLDDETIPRLNCDIVAGSANNQLADASHDALLREHDITYAPDYLVNSGGLIYVASYYAGHGTDRACQQIEAIYETLLEVFDRADSEGLPTGHVTDRIAEERLEAS
jgi:leucine dehydrogenase